ncbi:class I SAM-dependent methyltransferase [Streptomyces sp. NPDC091377]|uniref:class I SAM-dependent methyltransferase n=1 Tax=unclassified Streptomyces TaxID=2593676 RepID=UPI0038244732
MGDKLMDCPVCGTGDAELFAKAYDKEYFTSSTQYRYARCGACSAVYLDDPPADRLDEIYPPNYYSYGGIEGSTAFTERIKEKLDGRTLRRILAKIPGERLRVLDVGGGAGWLLTTARRVCPRVAETHEVDMQEAAAPAAERAGHVYHCMPVEEFTSGEKFDLIMMMSVIEHVPDPARVLRQACDLLSDDGVLLVKTPNTATWDCRIFRHRNWGGFHCPRHFVLFTRDGLADLGERCGLRARSSAYTQGAPQWALSVMAWLQDRGLIKVTSQRPAYRHWTYEPLTALFAALDYARAPFAPTAQMTMQLVRAPRPAHPGGADDPPGTF